jgi:HSP20 family molecular chaperone IbpA
VYSPASPAAEIAKDRDDAVVQVELPGVDVEKDVTVEVDKGQLVIRGERRAAAQRRRTGARSADPVQVVPAVVQAACTRHQRRDSASYDGC